MDVVGIILIVICLVCTFFFAIAYIFKILWNFISVRRNLALNNSEQRGALNEQNIASRAGQNSTVIIAHVDIAVRSACEKLNFGVNPPAKIIPSSELCRERLIQSNTFKAVWIALWKPDSRSFRVAMIHARQSKIKFLRHELRVHNLLQQHPGVASLYGVTEDGNSGAFLVLEWVSLGSLDQFLIGRGELLPDVVKTGLALQVASAMCAATRAFIVHRGLSARKVLLAPSPAGDVPHVKLAGFDLALICGGNPAFGLDSAAEDNTAAAEVRRHFASRLAARVRWAAPECLDPPGHWSEASDVWAFGVLLWEVHSAGEVPYGAHVAEAGVADLIRAGRRLPPPQGCPDRVYTAMQHCWIDSPTGRPTFERLKSLLVSWSADYVPATNVSAAPRTTSEAPASFGPPLPANIPSAPPLLLSDHFSQAARPAHPLSFPSTLSLVNQREATSAGRPPPIAAVHGNDARRTVDEELRELRDRRRLVSAAMAALGGDGEVGGSAGERAGNGTGLNQNIGSLSSLEVQNAILPPQRHEASSVLDRRPPPLAPMHCPDASTFHAGGDDADDEVELTAPGRPTAPPAPPGMLGDV